MRNANAPKLEMMYLYVTNRCNMLCKHCWVNSSPAAPSRDEVDYQVLEKAIREAKDLGLEAVKITGGEPFIKAKLCRKLLELCSTLEIAVAIETNGTLITEEDTKLMKVLDVGEVGVSLDFAEESEFEEFRGLKGSFKRVVATIKLLKKHDVRVACLITVMKSNLDKLDKIVEFAFSLGADAVKLNPLVAIGRAKTLEEFSIYEYIKFVKILIKLNKAWPKKVYSAVPPALLAPSGPEALYIARGSCSIKNLLSILPNGEVTLCGIGITHPELIIGNIKKSNIKEIWMSAPGCLSEVRKLDPSNIRGVCSKCLFRAYCANLCPAYVYEAYKTFTASFPICQKLYELGKFPRKYLAR